MKAKNTAKTETINGVIYNVCPHCSQAVRYPEGLNLRKGGEMHIKCWQERRKQA